MIRIWSSLLALTISVLSAGVVLYCGGQDKLGQFRVDLLLADVGVLLFFVGP